MSARVPASLVTGLSRAHEVEIQPRTTPDGHVRLEVLRSNRRRAEGDLVLELPPSRARDLMKALQGAADEADRLAYQRAKAAERYAGSTSGTGLTLHVGANSVAAPSIPVESLEQVVDELARKLGDDDGGKGAA